MHMRFTACFPLLLSFLSFTSLLKSFRRLFSALSLHQVVCAAAAANEQQCGHGDEPPARAVGALVDGAVIGAVVHVRADIIAADSAGWCGRSDGSRNIIVGRGCAALIYLEAVKRACRARIGAGRDYLALVGLADGAGVEPCPVCGGGGLLGDNAVIPAVVALGYDLGLHIAALGAGAGSYAGGKAGGFLCDLPLAVIMHVLSAVRAVCGGSIRAGLAAAR